jgi:hypothetical protein
MTAKIPGIIISMAGEDWIVPPLTLGQLRRLMPKIKQISEIGLEMDGDTIGTIAEVTAEALRRNYPDVTPEKVENELLDLGNAGAVLQAILAGSGLRSRGEAQAKSSTGPTSTDSSPTPADLAPEPSTN